MKLRRKIAKLAQPLTYRRGWRRAQRSIFRLPIERLRTRIDQKRLCEIQRRYADSPAGYAKYANVDHWLRLNRERVQDLKLHRSAPKRVLDLGCGGGFFLFILKALGHPVLGLDAGQAPLYTELIDLFGVPRIVWTIKPFEPLPEVIQRFDWITAFSVSFNVQRPTKQLWGVAEWDFFCVILSDTSSRAAESFSGSIRHSAAIITHLSCAIFS